MSSALSRILFTPSLYCLLIANDYTHIYHRGLVEKIGNLDDSPKDDYILVPLKEDFTLIFEESDLIVEPIDSLSMQEMLEYTMGIDFWIEAPEQLINEWKQLIKD